MLQRYARQVLTAGKQDEVVADGGGPRPGHSVFTGHLLNALDGDAAGEDGVLSALAVMSYVYERVSRDSSSQQTPAFGLIDGDGDMILAAPNFAEATATPSEDSDTYYEVPPVDAHAEKETESSADEAKRYLSDPMARIKLNDLAVEELRKVIGEASRKYSVSDDVTAELFAARIEGYWETLRPLAALTALTSHWGTEVHQPILSRIVTRIADPNRQEGGKTVWLGLRWYPSLVLAYAGGISALANENYQSLKTVLFSQVGNERDGMQPAIKPIVAGILDVDRADMFKRLPGHENQYVPRSEYLFGILQPELEDLLFLGASYESVFDRFEILYALAYADLIWEPGNARIWGPIGRFGWKHSSRSPAPFDALVEEAEAAGAAWGPIGAGMFRGSIERFVSVAGEYRAQLLQNLGWY